MTQQHREGRSAHGEGKHRRDNPYSINTNEWMNWMDGYDQAASDAQFHPGKRSLHS